MLKLRNVLDFLWHGKKAVLGNIDLVRLFAGTHSCIHLSRGKNYCTRTQPMTPAIVQCCRRKASESPSRCNV